MSKINDKDFKKLNLQYANYGSIMRCKECSGLVCCGIVSEGGVIEPPYLTNHDISQIEHFTGFRREQFALERKNPVTGNSIFIMTYMDDGGCIFFNKSTGKCDIYFCRPVDCRLFPLDCRLVTSGRTKKTEYYYWVLYKFKRCKLKMRDMSALLNYRDEALRILCNELRDFATYPLPEMERIGFKRLMKLGLGGINA